MVVSCIVSVNQRHCKHMLYTLSLFELLLPVGNLSIFQKTDHLGTSVRVSFLENL